MYAYDNSHIVNATDRDCRVGERCRFPTRDPHGDYIGMRRDVCNDEPGCRFPTHHGGVSYDDNRDGFVDDGHDDNDDGDVVWLKF